MAISSMDQLVAAMTAATAQNLTYAKVSAASKATGTYFDHFFNSGIPGPAVTPDAASSGGNSYNSATIGAMPFAAPAGAADTYLAGLGISCTQPASLYLMDRLWGCRGLSGTLSATTSVTGMTPITRYSGGVGCEIWYTCLTAPSGGGTGNMTVTYTNSAGVSGRTCTIALTGVQTQYQCFQGTLQDNDKGVQSIQSVTNTSVSFTGGSHGLFIVRRLATCPIAASVAGMGLDGLQTGLQTIDDNACLSWVQLCSTTNTGAVIGNLILVQG